MKRAARIVLGASLVLVSLSAVACRGAGAATPAEKSGADAPVRVRIGVMRGEGALPVWVAEREGLLADAGLEASVIRFDSADERKTALVAGAVDCAVGDAVTLCLLERGGFRSSAVRVMLGTGSGQGRHGIVAKPGSDARTLADLAGRPVGTSLNTQQEYVVDTLFARAGVPEGEVVKSEVKKLPLRYQFLMQGKLEAAALPEPLLSLAQVNGARLIADDTKGEILSVSYLIAGDEWLGTPDGAEAMTRLLGAIAGAVSRINADPDSWRPTLVENAGVPDGIADTYPVQTYPAPAIPAEDSLARVQEWMLRRELIGERIPYADLVWEPDS